MKSRTKEQGSIVHTVVIIVLVVAVLGLLGFVFWQNFVNKKPATTASTNTTQMTQQTASTTKPLAVSEWGVTGTYDQAGLSDVSYTIDSNGRLTLTATGLPDGCGGLNGIGLVYRLTGDQPLPVVGDDETTAQAYQRLGASASFVQIGNYYYLYYAPNAPCDPDGGTIQTQLKAALKQIVANLQ